MLFENIEKLITEHGSAAILRERLELANEQYAVLERRCQQLDEQVAMLEEENQRLQSDIEQARQQIRHLDKVLHEKSTHNQNPHGYVCDHCGSTNLNRTGSRPDPIFGDLGTKQEVFTCADCGKESSFTPPHA